MFLPITLKSTEIIYYNIYTGYICIEKPLVNHSQTGGILADEMGLGKTVEVLACILNNPRPDYESFKEDLNQSVLEIESNIDLSQNSVNLDNLDQTIESDLNESNSGLNQNPTFEKFSETNSELNKKTQNDEVNESTSDLNQTKKFENSELNKKTEYSEVSESTSNLNQNKELENMDLEKTDNDKNTDIQTTIIDKTIPEIETQKKYKKPKIKRLKEKKIKPKVDKQNDKPKPKTSLARLAAQQWYENKLAEMRIKIKPKRSREKEVQCICGDFTRNGIVYCVDCQKMQHFSCMGYKGNIDEYSCPQCWINKVS